MGAIKTAGRTGNAQETTRAALARHAGSAGRRAMDSAYGGTMVGTAAPQVSAVPDLPPPIPGLGARRHAGQGFTPLGRGPVGAGRVGSGGDVYRRLLHGSKKGGRAVGPTRRGKGSKIMAIADRHGLPVAVGVASASPHETQLVEATLQQRFTKAKPRRMIGDSAYDSDPLDQRRRQQGVRLIAPHKSNRWSRIAPLLPPLEDRASVRLAA